MITHLYIKQHKITGLKYFGKTTKNPYKYKGSGKYWRRHLKIHGNETITNVIASFSTDQTQELVEFALNFSKENDVANSEDWANLKPENGLDGGTFSEYVSKQTKEKMSRSGKGVAKNPAGWVHSDASKKQMSISAKRRCEILGLPKSAFKKGMVPVNKGVPATLEQKIKISQSILANNKQLICTYCGKSMNPGNFAKWHGDKCKMK